MSNPDFWEKKKKIINLVSAEFAQRVQVKGWIDWFVSFLPENKALRFMKIHRWRKQEYPNEYFSYFSTKLELSQDSTARLNLALSKKNFN